MNAWAVTVGLVASSALGQVTLEVKDFSDVARAQVHLEQPGEVFSPGWVALIDKQTGKVLVRVKSDELAVTTGADGTANSNVRELPYGEQSVIIAGDFNFDGTPDVAVMDGQHSCYHGPSYQVFLAGPKGLRKSAAFTELAQSYCGFFDVDVPHQRLHTMTKSGCCWHEFSTFKVVNGAPVVEQVVTEDAKDAPLVLVTTTSGRKVVHTKQLLLEDLPGLSEVARFTLTDERVAVLFVFNELLHYALLDAKGSVELLVPGDDEGELRFAFASSPAGATLSFSRPGASYLLTQVGEGASAKLSIAVTTPTKRANLEAKSGTLTGGLPRLGSLPAENVDR